MTLTVSKCVKLNSKLQLNCFICFKICHFLGFVNHRINCIYQGQWPINMTALTAVSSPTESVTYWLAKWCWRWYLLMNCLPLLAYQVMLTIRGRLITPFVLGSMSVGLNILIRHSFMDLWVWITALVPWPQLLIPMKYMLSENKIIIIFYSLMKEKRHIYHVSCY